MDLSKKSAEQLNTLAKRATSLAQDLQKREPSYELAIENGIRDKSYSTVRYGRVPSYAGEVEITMSDGSRWRAIGHGPTGNAHVVTRDGYIEFIPL